MNRYSKSTLVIAVLMSAVNCDARAKQRQPKHVPSKQAVRDRNPIKPADLHGKVAFMQAGDVRIVNSDGTADRLLIKACSTIYATGDAAFDDSLSRITFPYRSIAGEADHGYSLCVINIDGAHRRQLVPMNGTDIINGPRFSPDGRYIVYTRWTGTHSGGPMTAGADIWIIKADGSGARRVQGNYLSPAFTDYDARWSRDGRRIFLLEIKGRISESPDNPRPVGIPASINVDGSDPQSAEGQYSRFVLDNYSPDGKLRVICDVADFLDEKILLKDSDGGNSKVLLANPKMQVSDARFSPDGSKVIFNVRNWKTVEGSPIPLYSIWVINTDRSGLRRIVDGGEKPTFLIQWLR